MLPRMPWLTDPFATEFFARAVAGGVLAALVCAVAGAWVVARGMAFFGEALGHGMLPGVALASLAGAPPLLGAAASAVVMGLLVGAVARSRLQDDTAIGIAFVGMLSAGVIVVSRSGSFATDVTAILFGDVLAVRAGQLLALSVGLALTLVTAAVLHRPLVALAFDERVAHTLGLRPRLARAGLLALVVLAVVASYQAVGTLLVVALLVGPPAAAALWARSVRGVMLGGALVGSSAVVAGLLASWHLGTAGGASIALCAVLAVAASAGGRTLHAAWRRDDGDSRPAAQARPRQQADPTCPALLVAPSRPPTSGADQ